MLRSLSAHWTQQQLQPTPQAPQPSQLLLRSLWRQMAVLLLCGSMQCAARAHSSQQQP
jgi:hypothetical protein